MCRAGRSGFSVNFLATPSSSRAMWGTMGEVFSSPERKPLRRGAGLFLSQPGSFRSNALPGGQRCGCECRRSRELQSGIVYDVGKYSCFGLRRLAERIRVRQLVEPVDLADVLYLEQDNRQHQRDLFHIRAGANSTCSPEPLRHSAWRARLVGNRLSQTVDVELRRNSCLPKRAQHGLAGARAWGLVAFGLIHHLQRSAVHAAPV